MEPVDRVRVRAREGDSEVEREDVLAVEEPLEIRIRPAGRRAGILLRHDDAHARKRRGARGGTCCSPKECSKAGKN